MPKKKTQEKLTMSKALKQLEDLSQSLEDEDIDLEESIDKFKKGVMLARYLKKRLTELENQIIQIKQEFKDIQDN